MNKKKHDLEIDVIFGFFSFFKSENLFKPPPQVRPQWLKDTNVLKQPPISKLLNAPQH